MKHYKYKLESFIENFLGALDYYRHLKDNPKPEWDVMYRIGCSWENAEKELIAKGSDPISLMAVHSASSLITLYSDRKLNSIEFDNLLDDIESIISLHEYEITYDHSRGIHLHCIKNGITSFTVSVELSNCVKVSTGKLVEEMVEDCNILEGN